MTVCPVTPVNGSHFGIYMTLYDGMHRHKQLSI